MSFCLTRFNLFLYYDDCESLDTDERLEDDDLTDFLDTLLDDSKFEKFGLVLPKSIVLEVG